MKRRFGSRPLSAAIAFSAGLLLFGLPHGWAHDHGCKLSGDFDETARCVADCLHRRVDTWAENQKREELSRRQKEEYKQLEPMRREMIPRLSAELERTDRLLASLGEATRCLSQAGRLDHAWPWFTSGGTVRHVVMKVEADLVRHRRYVEDIHKLLRQLRGDKWKKVDKYWVSRFNLYSNLLNDYDLRNILSIAHQALGSIHPPASESNKPFIEALDNLCAAAPTPPSS